MNSRERVIAAMERRPVDRMPVFPVVTAYLSSRVLGLPYRNFMLDPLLQYNGLRALARRFGFDGMEVPLAPSLQWRQSLGTVEIDGEQFLASDGRPFARLQEDDAAVPLAAEPRLADKRSLDGIRVPPASEYEDTGCLEPIRSLVDDLGISLFLAGHAAGQTMNSLAAWRGSEQALLDLFEDPVFVLEAMERATDISIEIGRAMIQAGVAGIYIGDAWASASIISPRDYERFCQPFHARAAQAFQDLGAKVYLHICGNCEPILELMADTGVDAIEPLDGMDAPALARAKQRVGDRVCLKGGVSTAVLFAGSPREVYRTSVEAIEAAGPTGYILGSGDDIPRDAPLENIDAMCRAARTAEEGGSQ